MPVTVGAVHLQDYLIYELLFRFVQGHPWICIYLNQVSHSYDDMVQDKEDYSGTNSEIIIQSFKYLELQVQKIISVPKMLKNNFVVFFPYFQWSLFLFFDMMHLFWRKMFISSILCVMKTFQDYFVLPGVFRVSWFLWILWVPKSLFCSN